MVDVWVAVPAHFANSCRMSGTSVCVKPYTVTHTSSYCCWATGSKVCTVRAMLGPLAGVRDCMGRGGVAIRTARADVLGSSACGQAGRWP